MGHLLILKKKIIRKNEILHTLADINLAKKELGWFPIYDVKDGLKKLRTFLNDLLFKF